MSALFKVAQAISQGLWWLLVEILCHLPMALTIATILYLFNVIIVI